MKSEHLHHPFRRTAGNRQPLRPAFTITEMISVLMVFAFVLTLVTKVVHTHFDVNRRLTASANRAAAAHSFTHQLRADLLAAESFALEAFTDDHGLITTTVTIGDAANRVTYVFSRIDHADAGADREPAIDQVIQRTRADGDEHRWVLSAQTIDVIASPGAPNRILILKFDDNGPMSPGFNRRERIECAFLTGGPP